jgi:hypothetical protein
LRGGPLQFQKSVKYLPFDLCHGNLLQFAALLS